MLATCSKKRGTYGVFDFQTFVVKYRHGLLV